MGACKDRCRPLLVACAVTVASAAFAQSTRPGWGSTPYRDAQGTGVTFRVWAPNATSVTVPGQFNNWSTTATPLGKERTNGVWTGVWSGDRPAAAAGQQYKYFLNGSLWKRDPRNRKVISSGGNSIIYDPAAFDWSGDNSVSPALEDLFIYELHIGTFYDPNPNDSTPGQFATAILKLDYLKGLGINAVEVMPVAEFPGEDSWGYNPADPYAVENLGCGGPDGFKAFVKACHSRGMAVLLDVVHNHYGPAEMDVWNFDGWSGGGNGGGIYFYQDSPQCCTDFGPRPNYGSQPVRNYIQDNFRMWLDEYRVDGFRWDTPGLMMNASDTFINDAATLITNITGMMGAGYPGKLNIAEDVIGYGFNSSWDTSFPYALTAQLANTPDSNRDMAVVGGAVAYNTRFVIPAGLNRTVYLESHDVVGDLNNGVRLPASIDPATPDSYWARKRSTLGAAVAFTSPGVPMLFQGQEMLESRPFNSALPMDWSKTVTYTNIVRLYRDLIWLRRDLYGVTGGLKGERCAIYQVDNAAKMLACRRWKTGEETRDVVVVANFADSIRANYTLTFPRAGVWRVYFNSDSRRYGADFGGVGPSQVTATGNPPTATVTIGPCSALILSQNPPPSLSIVQSNSAATLTWPAAYGGWIVERATTLAGAPPSWSTIPAGQYQSNSSSFFLSLGPTNSGAFYRLRNW